MYSGTNKRVERGSTRYEIVVRGELSGRFAPEFPGGMNLKAKDEKTALVGEVIDQSHLHGLPDRLHDFGLELLSVGAISEREEG